MKKLLSIIMLLNFAPMIVCSEENLNKKLAYEILTNGSNTIINDIKNTITNGPNTIVKGIKSTIKAAIPGCSVACLVKEACDENDHNKLDSIQQRFEYTQIKTICAIPIAILSLIIEDRRLVAFFGAHAISGIGIVLGKNFTQQKSHYLQQKNREESEKKRKEQIATFKAECEKNQKK